MKMRKHGSSVTWDNMYNICVNDFVVCNRYQCPLCPFDNLANCCIEDINAADQIFEFNDGAESEPSMALKAAEKELVETNFTSTNKQSRVIG